MGYREQEAPQAEAGDGCGNGGDVQLERLPAQPRPWEDRPLDRLVSAWPTRERRSNLPAQPWPLVGRDEELAAAGALLLRPDVRLVTLTGPGGTGKTRLAVELATRLAEQFERGAGRSCPARRR